MLALVKTKPGKGLSLLEVDNPVPAVDEVLLKVAAAGICGSDVHIYEWTSGYEWMEDVMPVIPGHEVTGVIVEKGAAVDNLAVGDKVVCMPGNGCGKCDLCLDGLIAICPDKKQIGLQRDGAFAEYVAVAAATCVKLPDQADMRVSALAEPMTVSARAVQRAGNLFGKKVAVIGAGIIGLGAAYYASLGHARVWLFGKEQDREKFQISKRLGTEDYINVDRDSDQKKWSEITNNKGFDAVFDCTGVSSLIQQCLDMTKVGGEVIAVGIYPSPVQIDLRGMVRQEKSIITSYGYTRSIFEGVVTHMGEFPHHYENLITHTYTLKDGLAAVKLAAKSVAVKIVLCP
jgi:L-iditol 2-dehydrogenase